MILNTRLKEIASWGASRYDCGVATSTASIESMDIFLKKLSEASIPEPFLYPTHIGGLIAEWSLPHWQLSVELDADGMQLYFHGLDMRMHGVWENTANSKDDTETNELLIFIRHFFNSQEYLPDQRINDTHPRVRKGCPP